MVDTNLIKTVLLSHFPSTQQLKLPKYYFLWSYMHLRQWDDSYAAVLSSKKNKVQYGISLKND